MSQECDFSLVIPAFNEAERILPTLEQAVDCLDNWRMSYEITVVDDGSSDDTLAVCHGFAAAHPEVQVISYTPNRGKGHAVKAGVLASRGRVIAFSDADMPVRPEDYGLFIEALRRGNELAIGSRYVPKARWDMPLGRKVAGWGFQVAVRLLTGSRVSDTQFGFKAFTRAAAEDLFSSLSTDGFAFDAELIRMAQERGYSIVELPVRGTHVPGSKVRPVHDGVAMLWQLMLIRLRSYRGKEARPALPARPKSPALKV